MFDSSKRRNGNPGYVKSWTWESTSDDRNLRAGKLKTSFSSSVPLPPSELQPVQLRDLRYWCTDRAAAAAARGVHYDREEGACVQPAAAGLQYDQQQRACSTKFEERDPSDALTPAAAAPAAATAAGGDAAAALTAAVGVKWAPAVLAARKAANAAAVAWGSWGFDVGTVYLFVWVFVEPIQSMHGSIFPGFLGWGPNQVCM